MATNLNTDEIRERHQDRKWWGEIDTSSLLWLLVFDMETDLNKALNEIDRLKEEQYETTKAAFNTTVVASSLSKSIEQRTKEAIVQPVWIWICEVINTKGKTFQKAELERAIDSVGKE